MSNELTPQDDEHPLDWLKESSHITINHLSHFSEVSKDHFLDDLLRTNQLQIPPTPQQRQRAKNNSKNYRDRKKNQLQHIQYRLEELQKENQLLKSQKYCKWCRRSFNPHALIAEEVLQRPQVQKGHSFRLKDETFKLEPEFQKPDLSNNKRIERKGKIWIALGVLMLVLGLTLYGFDGDKTIVKEIQLPNGQIEDWIQKIHSKEEEYIDVRMRVKEEPRSFGKMDPGELKILYNTREQHRPGDREDRIGINKELLLGIQAELDDVGFYL